MENSKLLAMVFKSGEEYVVWNPEIPADDPLLMALMEKYETSGGSVCGSKKDINYADMEIEDDTDPKDDMEIASSDEAAGQMETESDVEDDAYNLAYSCLIGASDEESPITAAEAAYTLQCWREEGEYVNVTPEAFAEAWNDVLEQLKGGRA